MAVAFWTEHPLMKFFDRLPKTSSLHETAASTRLDALTKRGRAESAAYPVPGEPASSDVIKRLFRLPDEISSGDNNG